MSKPVVERNERGEDSVWINPTDQPSNSPAFSNSDASTAPASRKKLPYEIAWQSITAAEVTLPGGWPPFDDPTPWPTPPGRPSPLFLRRFSFFLDDTRLEREHDVRLFVFLAHDPRSQLACRFRDPRDALGTHLPSWPELRTRRHHGSRAPPDMVREGALLSHSPRDKPATPLSSPSSENHERTNLAT